CAPELVALGVRLQQRELHYIAGVETGPQARVQLKLGQQQQVRAEAVQRNCGSCPLFVHDSFSKDNGAVGKKIVRAGSLFFKPGLVRLQTVSRKPALRRSQVWPSGTPRRK